MRPERLKSCILTSLQKLSWLMYAIIGFVSIFIWWKLSSFWSGYWIGVWITRGTMNTPAAIPDLFTLWCRSLLLDHMRLLRWASVCRLADRSPWRLAIAWAPVWAWLACWQWHHWGWCRLPPLLTLGQRPYSMPSRRVCQRLLWRRWWLRQHWHGWIMMPRWRWVLW